MEDADDESAAALGLALKRVGNVMNALALGPDYNVLLANGRNAGQEVFHVHYHLIPRTGKSDGLGYRWKVGRLLPQAQIVRRDGCGCEVPAALAASLHCPGCADRSSTGKRFAGTTPTSRESSTTPST